MNSAEVPSASIPRTNLPLGALASSGALVGDTLSEDDGTKRKPDDIERLDKNEQTARTLWKDVPGNSAPSSSTDVGDTMKSIQTGNNMMLSKMTEMMQQMMNRMQP